MSSGLWRTAFMLPALILLEVVCMFCLPAYKQYFPQSVTSVGGFLAALATGAVVLLYPPLWKATSGRSSSRRKAVAVPLVIFSGIAILLALFLKKLFAEQPVTVLASDIIPTIQVLCRRLLAGEAVYKPIEEFGYHLPVTYLPLHWLPYLPAHLFQWDERWTAFAIFAVAAALCIRVLSRYTNAANGIAAALLIGLSLYWIGHFSAGVFSMSVEVMIAGYYMLFILSLGSHKPWMTAAGILLCLLSRYSLVLWLPLWAFITFIQAPPKRLLLTIGLVLASVLLLYIAPFLSKDWSALPRAYRAYSGAALGEWQHLDEAGLPYHLYAGSGAAWYFHSRLPGYSLADRLHSLQKVHLLLCLSTVVVLAGWYLLRARKRLLLMPFLLGSFKIYLAVFLMFIQVPYTYLMVTGPMVSIAIWAALARWRAQQSREPDAVQMQAA